MGVVDDDLADERAAFISIHDAVTAIAQFDGTSYKLTARWLYQKLNSYFSEINGYDGMEAHRYDHIDGLFISNQSDMTYILDFLRKAAVFGDPGEGWADIEYTTQDDDESNLDF